MIAMIDNYDSFTYNIVQMMQRVSGQEVRVLGSRNCTLQDLIKQLEFYEVKEMKLCKISKRVKKRI